MRYASYLISALNSFVYDVSKPFKEADTLKALDALSKSYTTLRVVGRGTIVVDPEEIEKDDTVKVFIKKAKEIELKVH